MTLPVDALAVPLHSWLRLQREAVPLAQRAEAFKTKYTFKTEMDADAKKFMFPQNERLNKA